MIAAPDTAVRLVLPWPPSINDYYARSGRSKAYLTQRAKAFRVNVGAAVIEAGCWRRFVNGERLALFVELYPPDRRTRDIDNFDGKPLIDALMHAGLFLDDSQIDERHTYRCVVSPPSGRCEVAIWAIGGEG